MSVDELSRAIATIGPTPDWWIYLTTVLVALAVVMPTSALTAVNLVPSSTLRAVTTLSTLVHESGHAAINLVTGGGVHRIEISSPDSGSTSGWHAIGLPQFLSSAAGYAMPTLAGLGAAALVSQGRAAAVLAITVALALLVLLVTRDLLTLGCVLAIGGIAFAGLWWAPVWVQSWLATAEAWLLLLGELGGLCAIVSNRWHGADTSTDDASALAEQTGVPAPVWIVGWFVLLGWGAWTGAGMLLPA